MGESGKGRARVRDDRLLRLVPMIEVGTVELVAPWPMADGRLGAAASQAVALDWWLPLSDTLGHDQIGHAVAVIVEYNCADELRAAVRADAALRLFVEHVAQPDNLLLVSGGLALMDERNDIRIDPGCCFGLENWRDWAEALSGGSPWLGHSPDPWIEHREGETLRVWADRDVDRSSHIDLTKASLADLITEAERDLVGFLAQLGRWARIVAPDHADSLVRVLDEGLHIGSSREN